MGVTIAYRGSMADIQRVEDFEDRVIDLALEIGGHVRVWRSFCDDDPQRAVRGVMLELYPGQETTSLLVSPEGWLINLVEIEDAEKGELADPPWCFVKTQFGSVEGHVALVELLAALKREYFPDLEVRDEGEYWETRDWERLRAKIGLVQAAIDGLADGLRQYGLTAEAAEDPEILATRIERVAQTVRQTLARIPEHPPVSWDDDSGDEFDDLPDGTEAQWDAFFKEQRRKQERLHRTIEERMARGDDHHQAFEGAMRDEGLIDLPGEPSLSEVAREMLDACEDEQDESWRESLPDAIRDADDDADDDAFDDALKGALENALEDELEDGCDNERHPLIERAMDLHVRLFDLATATGQHSNVNFQSLLSGAGEMLGGLSQAMSGRDDELPSGLGLVQLKRSLRGAAFAFGMLFPLRADGLLTPAEFKALCEVIKSLQDDIYAELARIREARES